VEIHQETPLNIDLILITKERYSVWRVLVAGGRVNKGDQDVGILLMDFIYLPKIENKTFVNA
jgi:hypothetical protein